MWGVPCVTLLLAGCYGVSRPTHPTHLGNSQSANKTTPPGVYHEVKPGQTLWSIARAYRVEVDFLARANNLASTTTVHTGQKLYIPGAAQLREANSRCPCGPESTPIPTKPVMPFLRTPERSPVTRLAIPPSSFSNHEPLSFVWPVQGDVSRGFEQEATRRHDGIDIAARQGTPIRAAAEGEVIFSGWGPGGYGRTVILQHQAELVTIYAHNHENLVQVGQRIRQGESIATVGQTGRATGNHLHFEVRYKAVPISPYKFLLRKPSHVAALIHE